MSRRLPENPSLEYLKKEARQLLENHRQKDPAACSVLRHLTRFLNMSDEKILDQILTLQQVQHALAREYGFPNWTELKESIPELRKVNHHFPKTLLPFVSPTGKIKQWPVKRKKQLLFVEHLAKLFQKDVTYSEIEVNEILNGQHTFGDPALLRRELIMNNYLARTADCSVYWKL